MSSQRWRQIEELYHSACEHGPAVLDGVDPEIRTEVEKLLSHASEGDGKLLDQRASDLICDLNPTSISPGARLGPYKIETLLGQGGMGQVFRALDTRLSRRVAIKICKEDFIDRFEQEARSIAVISHPNVCTLYDVGPNYLVMELVEGETLAARLKRGKLSLNETIRFGAQIAEALSVAHAQGIVHRDLKPANVMLTRSGIKVLDFGLAKSSADPSFTAEGGVMGTPAYIAPERFEGKEADARSDIYSLGLVLAEMASGKRSSTPEDLPPGLDRVVKRCLESDPDERWQNARDLKWELESIPLAVTPPSPGRRNILILGALAAVVILAVALAFQFFRAQPAPPPLTRASVMLPEKSMVRSLAVSPDGRFIAVVLVKDGKQLIWIRALDGLTMTPLEGTDNAADPFWSPDSRFLAFFADSKLKKIERAGGPVQTICNAIGALGGTWNQNKVILIGGLARLQTVSDSGGPVTDLPGHTITETYPSFLPDGRHYVATRDTGVWLGSIDNPEERRILSDVSSAQIVASSTGDRIGAVVFTRAGTLTALPFDIKKLEPAGEPYPVASGVLAQSIELKSIASVSSSGTVAWASGKGRAWECLWRDRKGAVLGDAGEGRSTINISPDGKQSVGDRLETGNWILDLATGNATPLSVNAQGMNPVWSPDGKEVAVGGKGGIYRETASGVGEPQLLLKTDLLSIPKNWSPDGRYILFDQVNPDTGSSDLFALPAEGDRPPLPLAVTPASEGQGQFSPDGRWIAYTSNESGESEIYVVPFPPNPKGGRWMVSRGGGVQPRWRRDGKELFYISQDWKMMAVAVETDATFRSGTPRALFDTEMVDTGIRNGPISWDIAPDGKRFLIITDTSQSNPSLNLILNWRPDPAR